MGTGDGGLAFSGWGKEASTTSCSNAASIIERVNDGDIVKGSSLNSNSGLRTVSSYSSVLFRLSGLEEEWWMVEEVSAVLEILGGYELDADGPI